MNLAPRYNVAPTQSVPVVRRTSARECDAVMMRWGLIPSWAKDTRLGARMINARAETVAEKPAFRGAFRSRRCLVPADGFYEWQARPGGKQPYRIARSGGGLFSFAGLWERWEKAADGAPVGSFTIVTTTATPELYLIHPRMPVILDSGGTTRSGSTAMWRTLTPSWAPRVMEPWSRDPHRHPDQRCPQRRRCVHRAAHGVRGRFGLHSEVEPRSRRFPSPGPAPGVVRGRGPAVAARTGPPW